MKPITTIGLLMVLVVTSWSQGEHSNTNDSLAMLRSTTWTKRYSAYRELTSNTAAMQSETVKNALLDLLDRENHTVESALRDSHEQLGISEKYGEEYGQYLDELGRTVDSFADWNDQHQVCILVYQSYEWNGNLAATIAAHPKASIPCLIQMYRSDVGLTRAEAAPTLVRALAAGEGELDPGTVQQAKQAILRALQDPHEAVRSKTVRSLGRYGRSDMIPALTQVAQSDPVLEGTAAKAISEIRKRGAGN